MWTGITVKWIGVKTPNSRHTFTRREVTDASSCVFDQKLGNCEISSFVA
jgi:hypothetical protein